jgi:hypothetical protein
MSDSDEERGFFSGVFFSADFMDGEVMFVLAEKSREGKKNSLSKVMNLSDFHCARSLATSLFVIIVVLKSVQIKRSIKNTQLLLRMRMTEV